MLLNSLTVNMTMLISQSKLNVLQINIQLSLLALSVLSNLAAVTCLHVRERLSLLHRIQWDKGSNTSATK